MTLKQFVVPDIGEGLADVEIVEWLVAVGDTVTQYQGLASVETDKSIIEIPSPFDGFVRELRGEPGSRVPVGSLLATIEVADLPADLPPSAGPAAWRARTRAAPSVRKLARSLGVDLDTVPGTGAAGLVTAADVERAAGTDGNGGPAETSTAETSTAQAAGSEGGTPAVASRAPVRQPLRGLRRTIARNMAAVASVPAITSHRELEISALLAWRARVNERRPGAPLTLTPFLALCVLGALRAVPDLNATYDPDAGELAVYPGVHLGFATATGDGLLVPVVRDADLKGLDALAAEIDALASAARARTLRPEQMRDGTFTISNYGARGGWFGTPLLRIPQVGIAGFGRYAVRPWVVNDQVVARPVLPLSVSADHRVIDGDVSGSFANSLAGIIGDPMRLVEGTPPWS